MTAAPSIQRLAAVGLLLAVIWIAIGGAIAPAAEGFIDDRQSIERSEELIGRYRQLAAQMPAIEQQLAALRQGTAARGFITAASASLASAKLQGEVQQLVAGAGVTLTSSQTMPVRDQDGFRLISLQFEFQTDAAGLVRLLHRIETATPVLFVDALSIRVPETGQPLRIQSGQPAVAAHMKVFGYWSGGGQ